MDTATFLDSDGQVAQKWFQYMATAGETRGSMHYFDAEEEASSRSMLRAAKEASGGAAFHRQLAQQMNEMSVREREKRYEEIHGVPQRIGETPDIVAAALGHFQQNIMMIREKPLYDHAVALNRSYIEGHKFRLMFIRAELFDVDKAVNRMLLFLEKKAQFFGVHTLGRPLRLSDLDVETLKVLKSGDYQILPFRDRAGRPVILQIGPQCGKKSYDCGLPMFKAWFYLHINLYEEDEETQKRGAVLIYWWMEPFRNLPSADHDLYNEAYYLVRWLPMRPYCSIHICMQDTPAYQIFARMMIALSVPEIRYHHKLHTGSSSDEMLRNLLPFGIPTDVLPVTATGGVKVKDLQRWFDRRRKKEEFLDQNPDVPFDRLELPGIRDVLFAKGKPYQSHLGNQEYLVLVNRLLQSHEAANRKGKREIVMSVIQQMRAKQARFLVRDTDGWWVELSAKDLIEKVSKAFSNASTSAAKNRSVAVTNQAGEETAKRMRAGGGGR